MTAIPRVRDVDLSPTIPIFLRRLHADSTRKAYEREIVRFTAWLADNHPLDAEVLPRYVEWLRARELSPTTVAWRATVVGEFLRDAHRQGVIASDLTAGYKRPRGTTGFAPRIPTAAQLKRLLATPDRRSWRGKRDACVLTLLGVAGLRAGEVAGLHVGDVQITPERAALRVTGKGNRVRSVALSGHPARPLRAWSAVRGAGDASEPGLLTKRAIDGAAPRGLSVASVDYIVRRCASAAGIEGFMLTC